MKLLLTMILMAITAQNGDVGLATKEALTRMEGICMGKPVLVDKSTVKRGDEYNVGMIFKCKK